ncbi:uncharacterized protein LOC129756915 isoform X2 [Uranotaenia lowii]|nr:uncharacterized protein LOC129756915 isoform X2 [Uranotaenia lowii]XP_055609951.1 uncharacterized protein LOC129756915 isoform X2 [Uranotaenia lowii]
MRRRTRSTGNLPCAPQPTEDSSSSPADQLEMNTSQNSPQLSGGNNLIQSDSDDRHTLAFAFRSRQTPICGNFESDSFNENFSPTRPNMRRKRKFKRMAVGYEASLSASSVTNSSIFPAIVKKRAFNHESLRANLFFCGKRKRSHRDRYMDFESFKQHSSSVPRQRDLFSPKTTSYLECKSRARASSFSSSVPLNRSLISKIEKIAQPADRSVKLCFQFSTPPVKNSDKVEVLSESASMDHELMFDVVDGIVQSEEVPDTSSNIASLPNMVPETSLPLTLLPTQKSSSIDSGKSVPIRATKSKRSSKSRVKHIKKRELMQLQPDERMMNTGMNDLLSSSSLSSSDSEAVESDHEGDDELTDWPGNEGMINFASKNEFKKSSKTRLMKPSLPQIKQQEDIQDDDTLMSTDDVCTKKAAEIEQNTIAIPLNCFAGLKYSPGSSEDLPMDKPCTSIASGGINCDSSSSKPNSSFAMRSSTHASTNLFSAPDLCSDIREIRAGCRRIRDERPGFSIISPANELLSRFLQNEQQVLTLLNINASEHEKLLDLSKLYSLAMHVDGGCVTLSKTSNTMQSVRIDHSNLPKSFADFKRRCYGEEDSLHFNDLSQ